MKENPYNVSAIILAGGLSERMGTRKAELPWDGKTLLEYQVDKMHAMGISDIIVSGYNSGLEGTRYVADKFMNKGPLAGIHAGLLAAINSHCIITAIDTPLVPVDTLSSLIETHIITSANITVLSHGDRIEPIIAVYENSLAEIAAPILATDNTSVRVLLKKVGYTKYIFTGDERLLCDCNTPRDYEFAKDIQRTATPIYTDIR